MEFCFSVHPDIHFGSGMSAKLGQIGKRYGWSNALLVSDPFFVKTGMADQISSRSEGFIKAVFSDIEANPTIQNADLCVKQIEANQYDCIVALGGGSSLDCAKAASVVAYTGKSVRDYHSGGYIVSNSGIPVIAVPTTAGTGSEVTNVAVLSDPEKGIKGPMASDYMYAKAAVVDPELTSTVPPSVTASTGLDALSHALEGYWSKNHQPICDACAIYAGKLVFENLEAAYKDGSNMDAREKMSLAALIAGIAFSLPKTAASHACSFPLTNIYHIPHGEACAFTLDSLVRINSCGPEADRMKAYAEAMGFHDTDEMADEILRLKRVTGMRCTLRDAKIPEEDVADLADRCKHPNLLNNPVEMTQEKLIELFMSLR